MILLKPTASTRETVRVFYEKVFYQKRYIAHRKLSIVALQSVTELDTEAIKRDTSKFRGPCLAG